MPSHFDSGRVTDNADSQQNQPEPVLRAAGKKFNLVYYQTFAAGPFYTFGHNQPLMTFYKQYVN